MKLTLALVSTIALISCVKNDEESTPVNNKVSAAELAAPSSLNAFDEARLKVELSSNNGYFLANSGPGDTGENGDPVEGGDPFATCLNDKVKSLKFAALGKGVLLEGSVDVTTCQEKIEGVTSAKAASVQIYYYIECTGRDFSSYVGNSFYDLLGIGDLNCQADSKILSNSKMSFNYSIGNGPSTYNVISEDTSSQSTSSNEPCSITYSNKIYTSDGCQEISKTINTGSEASSYYTKVVDSKLTYEQSDAASWYISGSKQATFNDWSGTVTYSGANVDPAYSFKKGSSTLTGTLSKDGSTTLLQARRQLNRAPFSILKTKIFPH